MCKKGVFNKLKFSFAVILAAAVFLRPQTAVNAAQNSMHMWYASVAPAIFPFLALMPLLTSPEACAAYERIFSPLMRPLFRLPGSAAPSLIISLVSGSPAGAVSLARMAGPSGMTCGQLKRFAPVICGVGPAYLVMGVGVGLYGSAGYGLKLAAVQLAVQLLMLLALRFIKDESHKPVRIVPVPESKGGIRWAVEAVLTVCGYMVLFSVAASVFAELTGPYLGRILLIAADLPSGMAALAEWNHSGREILMGMGVGFGGLCILFQNMDALRPLGLGWKDMLCVKFAQSALCGALFPLLQQEVFRKTEPDAGLPYVFSLLFALILSLPVLISLSKKLFLNKTKSEKPFPV